MRSVHDASIFIIEASFQQRANHAKTRYVWSASKNYCAGPCDSEHFAKHRQRLSKVLQHLAQKNKVKLTMRFRGREIVYAQSIGLEAMKKIAAALGEDAIILQPPKMEGRQLVMFVGPK